MTVQEKADFDRDSREIEIPFLPVDQDHTPNPTRSKYRHLTDGQYRVFMDRYSGPGSESEQIGFGFRVVGYLIQHASVAYGEYLIDSGDEPNLEELERTMVDGFDSIVHPLAELDITAVRPYETWLGLRDGRDNLFSATSYRFTRVKDNLHLMPKVENLTGIDGDLRALNWPTEHVVGPNRGCPALKFALPYLWGIDVEGCVRDPDYIPADIEAALEGAKVEA